jgi:SpoIID/LytB domain protein
MVKFGGRTFVMASFAVVHALVVATLVATPVSAAEEIYVRPSDGVFPLAGHGWGHGRGMSQWGAYSAAAAGRSATEILDFYYPGTVRAQADTEKTLRVRLEGVTGTALRFRAEPQLWFTWSAEGGGVGQSVTPASMSCGTVNGWRVAASDGGDLEIQGTCDGGNSWTTWQPASAVDGTRPVVATAGDGFVDISYGTSTRRGYRGDIRVMRAGSGVVSNNVLRFEQYLRAVVPNESPASWPREALRAQAVAARTYAMREAIDRAGQQFDVYDSTRSQVYTGTQSYDASWNVVTTYEFPRTDEAIASTIGTSNTEFGYRAYEGAPALTQFSSSNGGWTASGGLPYQRVVQDLWDWSASANPKRGWTDSVTAAELQARYPTVGSLQRIRVTQRDGGGEWGGRVLAATLEGTGGSVAIDGDAAIRGAFGTDSSYLTIMLPGSPGYGKIRAGGVFPVQVTGRAGVPTDAAAVVLNVTVTGPGQAGWLTVYPCGEAVPGTSNLNFAAGQTVANMVISKPGINGSVCLMPSATTHVIVDIQGYLPAGTDFRSVTQERYLDTRLTQAVAPRQIVTVPMTNRGAAQIPSDASSVAANATVTEPSGGGWITVFPCGQPVPPTSTVNFSSGTTAANAVLVKLGSGGGLCVYSTTRTHLLVDVTGWFPAGASYVATTPARYSDTRGWRPANPGETLVVTVTGGPLRVPGDAAAVTLNVTVTRPAAAGWLTVYPCGEAAPLASNVNFSSGQTVANAVIAHPGTSGQVCIYSSASTDFIVDVSGWFPNETAYRPLAPARLVDTRS